MEQRTESITQYLRRHLREAGTARFEAIADEATLFAGMTLDCKDRVNVSFIRKFFYDHERSPRVSTIQPLLDYFAAIDRGEKQLPRIESQETAKS